MMVGSAKTLSQGGSHVKSIGQQARNDEPATPIDHRGHRLAPVVVTPPQLTKVGPRGAGGPIVPVAETSRAIASTPLKAPQLQTAYQISNVAEARGGR
jgi:hypothetical protein